LSTLARYLLFQLPGFAIAAVVAVALTEAEVVSGTTALVAVALWAVKDALMYPFVKEAYRPDSAASPADRLIGTIGTSCEPIAPQGYARIGAELWRCRAHRATPIEAACRVRVVAAQGLTLTVEALDREPASATEAPPAPPAH